MAEKNTGHIYTVSKLTRELKSLLEETYPFLWIIGEISNYTVPVSGHSYFTLKDPQAVINAVMFKNQKNKLKFVPENGMKVMGMARLSLYEPRGTYQLIFEHLEPEGTGAMQLAFEQLKTKLSDQGYFDPKHKTPIPFLPSKINIITSATGAAVKDIINIATRRFSNCCLEIIPVQVQGEKAETEICDAIHIANQHQRSDVIILARGGGSLEDLAAFNSERVAMAVFNSRIPIITGIGHETDFTIADFVADLRAPTPSAAAELALPDKTDLNRRILKLQTSLNASIKKKTGLSHRILSDLVSRLKSPETILYDFRFKLEDYESRLNNKIKNYIQFNREKLNWLSDSLYSQRPAKKIFDYRLKVKTLSTSLVYYFQSVFQAVKSGHSELSAKLQILNPHAVLDRGYSISRVFPGKKIVFKSSDVNINDTIEIILSKGRLITKVEKTDG